VRAALVESIKNLYLNERSPAVRVENNWNTPTTNKASGDAFCRGAKGGRIFYSGVIKLHAKMHLLKEGTP
jgi:hypothetical protein